MSPGQVGGVAISSAIFQSNLERELRSRIHRPDAEDVRHYDPDPLHSAVLIVLPMQLIRRIRQSTRLISSLPPDLQRIARDSYSVSLKWVFFFATCSTLLAYLVRLPVRSFHLSHPSLSLLQRIYSLLIDNLQIPDKLLEHRPREAITSQSPPSDSESENYVIHDDSHTGQNGVPVARPRRLSTYENVDAVMDPESVKSGTSTSRRDR